MVLAVKEEIIRLFWGSLLFLGPEETNKGGKGSNEHNPHDDKTEVVLDEGQVSEQVPCCQKQEGPNNTPDNIVEGKLAKPHEGDARDEGQKGTKEGQKPAQADGPPTPFLEKGMSLLQMFLGN